MHENKSHILGRKGGVVLLVFVGWVQYAAIQSPWGQNPGPKFKLVYRPLRQKLTL